jgi:aminoglycoside phosphotransferase (APT) family kinase protein
MGGWLFGLQQARGLHAEHGGNAVKRVDLKVCAGAFDLGDARLLYAQRLCQLLLRKYQILKRRSYRGTESDRERELKYHLGSSV